MLKISFDIDEAKDGAKNAVNLVDGTEPILVEISQEKLKYRYILLPLFEQMSKSATAYWLIFFAVSFVATGMIVHYIDSYRIQSEEYSEAFYSEGGVRSAFVRSIDSMEREAEGISSTTTAGTLLR